MLITHYTRIHALSSSHVHVFVDGRVAARAGELADRLEENGFDLGL